LPPPPCLSPRRDASAPVIPRPHAAHDGSTIVLGGWLCRRSSRVHGLSRWAGALVVAIGWKRPVTARLQALLVELLPQIAGIRIAIDLQEHAHRAGDRLLP